MDHNANGLDGVPNLTPRDVAAATGLSYHAVLRTIHRGELVADKICGRVRLRKEDVMAWIERCRVELEDHGAPEPSAPPRPGSLAALRDLERRRMP